MAWIERSIVVALAALALTADTCADDFPAVYNSETETNAGPPSAEESLAKLALPPGFRATVFAAEPDVQNPIGMAWDARGRLWIAENYTYAERARRFDLHLRDRIVILEDADGDGRFDKRRVFTDDVQQLTSVEVGYGGVWAMCPPQLLFFPDADADGTPDGPAEVVLDGFHVPAANYHNLANGLRWGPDGWLYGRCGASAPGEIGVPGTPPEQRQPLRGGMWRYHPRRKAVEVISAGTMNAWGHDWNEHGEIFCCNTVGGHLWHVIPGAHYVAPHTVDPNQRVYQLIDMHADHWHFDVAQGWTSSRNGKANDYGGGHAHCGTMIYLGDNWPAAYRGRLFTLNMFGRRANQEILERHGSGYVARHGEDCLVSGDTWFRGMDLSYGPDGGVFLIDWCDAGECHEATGVHRTSGRIYKITYGEAKRSPNGDVAVMGVDELVRLHSHANEWFARQARLQLAERAREGREFDDACRQLRDLFVHETDPVHQLRAMWSLYAIGGADEAFLRAQLAHPDEHVRVWAIRLLSDFWPLDTVMSARPAGAPAEIDRSLLNEFVGMARSDTSGLVHLALATLLQRLPASQRAELAAPLLAHSEYADDHNLPLLIWYGLIPVGDGDPGALAALAADCQLPLTLRFIAHRLGEDVETNPKPLNELLATSLRKPTMFQRDVLAGLADALRGWRRAEKPAVWDSVQQAADQSDDAKLRERVRDLSVLFGDGRALDEVKRVALDEGVGLKQRQAALETLIESRPADLRKICEQLLAVRFLNSTAVRGLAQLDDPAIGASLAKNYLQFHVLERPAVMDTLTSRPSFARPLLEAMADGKMPRADMTPFHARQVRSFDDPKLTERLAEVWGQVRDSPADKRQAIADWKAKLTPAALAAADKSHGRALFNKTCASCHSLYGYGDRAGLDLTGAGRDNLDYLLDNIVDPSAVVNADFRLQVAVLEDGRTLNGIVIAQSDRTLTLKTQTETLAVDRGEIEHMQKSSLSLMPEGLLDSLSASQVGDLMAYLMHPTQVQLGPEP